MYGLLVMQRIFMPTTCKYTLARLMEQGRRNKLCTKYICQGNQSHGYKCVNIGILNVIVMTLLIVVL